MALGCTVALDGTIFSPTISSHSRFSWFGWMVEDRVGALLPYLSNMWSDRRSISFEGISISPRFASSVALALA